MHIPITGHPLHTRSITSILSLAEDGQWHMKGDLLDLRKTGFAPMSSSLQPAGIIHHMQLELILDPDTLKIIRLNVTQPVIAVEPSKRSCGDNCREPAATLQALVGECLDADFGKKLGLNFGGPKGCSHVLALFYVMAAAAPRAQALEIKNAGEEREINEVIFQETMMIDGFQCMNKDIELALQMGEYLVRPESTIDSPVERLDSENSLRIYARISAEDLQIHEFLIAERARTWETLANDQWHEHSEWATPFKGIPIIPGFAGKAMQECRLADGHIAPEKQLLLDALLQLAPGYIQVMAALADEWLADTKTAGESAQPLGGMPDSCYIWRSGGPLLPENKVAEHDLKQRGAK